MSINQRKKLIRSLELQLDVRLLAFVLGDRQGLETRVAPDVLPLASEHLARIGTVPRLALLLYTTGGDSLAAESLVNLLRQYCDKLLVLVPFRALSCGTLIALGGDEIIMGRHGLLSPIDPSVSSPFNPQAAGVQSGGPVQLLPVSVEDMIGFLDLARDEVKLESEESRLQVLKMLADRVHPLALGAVFRAREQNSSLAMQLMRTHVADEEAIQRIVNHLTRKLPSHGYLIGRKGARELGLPIPNLSPEVENLLWALYREYADSLKLTQPYSADSELGQVERVSVVQERAILESLHGNALLQHRYVTCKDIARVKAPVPGLPVPVDQVVERIVYQGWQEATDGEVLDEKPRQ